MKAAPIAETPGVLPLPTEVISHHGQSLFEAMKEWRSSRHMPPVLLLTGLPGVGKRAIGYYLAQWLLCERAGMNTGRGASVEDSGDSLSLFGEAPPAPTAQALLPEGDPRPCGECASCHKAIRGSWVDFEEIRTAEDEETLKIDQFRKLKTKQGFGAHESDYRVILIPDADRMTPQAANSVLKLLEEPPVGWVFILTASDANLLLPTLVSRCQSLRLKPFPQDSLERLLAQNEATAERKRLAVSFAEGSWARAIEWSQEAAWKKRSDLLNFLQEPVSSLNILVDWAATDAPSFHRLLDQLESLALDLIRFTLQPEDASPEKHAWHNSDAARALSGHARAVFKRRQTREAARAWWIERSERIARARQEIPLPLNRKLLAQDILLPWTR
jgi:DNA polymerase III delta prime subunit